MFPKPSTVACIEAFHQMVVEDSGYRVCTILAHPQDPTAPIHMISHAATALPSSMLNELQTLLSSKLGRQLPHSVHETSGETDLDTNDIDWVGQDELHAELGKQPDEEADGDPGVQEFDRSKYQFLEFVFFILTSCD